MIYCTFSVHRRGRYNLLGQYKYLIMSGLHVKEKCLKFRVFFFVINNSTDRAAKVIIMQTIVTQQVVKGLKNTEVFAMMRLT